MAKLTVRDLDFKDKKVIMRVDFNVPLEEGKISDDSRIVASLETINYILNKGAAKLILMSHLGRPKGKVVESLRMDPVASRLSELLGEPVEKLNDCIGEEVKKAIDKTDKKIILLENLRFYPQEEEGDEAFAKELASLADIYVNDAFGTAHRAHASTTIIAKFLPSCIGFLMEKEINYLSKIAFNPNKPFVAILGGAKVSDKIGVIENLLAKVDKLLIGGAMAYTFLKSQGIEVGDSLVEEDKLSLAKDILNKAKEKKVELLLPLDHLCVEDIEKPQTARVTIDNSIPSGFKGVDIGPETIKKYKEALGEAKTVLWNGPLGIFEKEEYCRGTKEIGLFLAKLSALVVVGGGDSASAAKKFGLENKLSHISTGGGASLEFLEGKQLPGVKIIPEKK